MDRSNSIKLELNGDEVSHKKKTREQYGPDVLRKDNKSEGQSKNIRLIFFNEDNSGDIQNLNEYNDDVEIMRVSRSSNEQ